MLRRRRHVVVSRRSIHGHVFLAHVALSERAESKWRLVGRVSATARVFRPDRERLSPRRWTLCALAHRRADDASRSRRIGRDPVRPHASAHVPMSWPVSTDGCRRASGSGTSAACTTGRRSDRGTLRRAVAHDARRIGALHQPSGAYLRTGSQDPGRPSVVGRTVPGGSLRSRASCRRPSHPARHHGLSGSTRDALHARHRRCPRLRAPQLPAFPRRPVWGSRGHVDRRRPHGRVLALGVVADRAHAG